MGQERELRRLRILATCGPGFNHWLFMFLWNLPRDYPSTEPLIITETHKQKIKVDLIEIEAKRWYKRLIRELIFWKFYWNSTKSCKGVNTIGDSFTRFTKIKEEKYHRIKRIINEKVNYNLYSRNRKDDRRY